MAEKHQELYRKYRPKVFKTIVGQDSVVSQLKNIVAKAKVPHALLFHGPSGCGKTTLARLVAAKMKCGEKDLKEMNSASCRGVDAIRDIERQMYMGGIQGPIRVWILDEAHKLTSDAQNALLKILEDPPDHSYFMLCTTTPNKVIATVRNRCSHMKVRLLKPAEMKQVIQSVAEKEKMELEDEVLETIVEHSLGSPRAALVALEAIMNIEGTDERIKAVTSPTLQEEAFKLIKMLLWQRADWKAVSKFLRDFEEDPEQFRHFILAVARTEILKETNKYPGKAYQVISAFRDNYFDCGAAGLAASCYEVVSGK